MLLICAFVSVSRMRRLVNLLGKPGYLSLFLIISIVLRWIKLSCGDIDSCLDLLKLHVSCGGSRTHGMGANNNSAGK